MLLILLNWFYILFTVFAIGYGFAKCCKKVVNYEIQSLNSMIAFGIVLVTVYAQFFSLFYKVGLVANAILVTGCIVIYVTNYADIKVILTNAWMKSGLVSKILVLVLFILWGYFTSRGYMHYDSDLYHAQSIRWIEEYGVIKGLGNLQQRLAYNSSIFAISALYSMQFIVGQSLHAVNGFIAFILSVSVLDIKESWKLKRFRLSDYARIGAIYYLFLIYDEIVSPASDFAIMCTVFFIVIKWLELLERDEKQIQPYALLCVAGVYAVSLKLTAGLILILLIKPVYMLISQKKWKDMFIYIGCGFITILPWLLRNIVLSGYLIYPFAQLDLFDVDWKIAQKAALLDAAEIKAWGKGINNYRLADTPFSQWIGNWFFNTLSRTEQLIIIADILCLVIMLAFFAVWIIKRKRDRYDTMLVLLTVACSYLFWQLSAPLFRYGYAYTLLVVLLVGGVAIRYLNKAWTHKVVYFAVILFGVSKLLPMSLWMVNTANDSYYITQKDYGKYDAASYEINGEVFYYPTDGDQVGYDVFPSSTRRVDLEFRGDSIEKGFKTFYE